ncbi:MAG TPA: YtxH domain-containing protein [Nitrospiraceae bacterium]|nr:YtxH domain-containing protein [Nitrospiraceae bacterium]
MADERGSSATVLLAFLSGAALGAVAALLMAPQSGRESRDQLRGYARRAEDNLRDLAGRAGEAFEEVVDQGKEFVDAKKGVLREAFEAGREAMKRERERARGEGPSGA